MTRLRVAAAQIECRPGDLAANLGLHLDAIGAARAAGADLVVFAELSLTDYLGAPDCAALALPPDAAPFAEIAAAAGPMAVSLGFIERAADGRCHNAQVLLAGDGGRTVHRKLNLPGYGRLTETRHYAGGDRLDPVPFGGWSVATLICADAWNPALPWLAALRGADLLALPTASARSAVGAEFDNPGGWRTVLAHTALVYGLPTVFVNHCGTRGELDFWGGSRILDADGSVLAQAGEGPELLIADLALARVRRARDLLPTMRDADPDLIARLLTASAQ